MEPTPHDPTPPDPDAALPESPPGAPPGGWTPRFGEANAATRDAWVRARLAELPAGASLLDAGAGEGPYRGDCGHLRYTAQDFGGYDGSGNGVALQTGRWEPTALDVVSDITAIPLPDASFDAVLCTEVLEHVPAPREALAELARLLRPGGMLILTAPFASFTHFAPFFFHTGFSRHYYEHWLPQMGFCIERIDANGSWYAQLAQELRRLPYQVRADTGEALAEQPRAAAEALAEALASLDAATGRDAAFACHGLHVLARRVAGGGSGAAAPA